MLNNVFYDAQFGDKFVTKSGICVIFSKTVLRHNERVVYCYSEDLGIVTYYTDGTCREFNDFDVVSKYSKDCTEEETITEFGNFTLSKDWNCRESPYFYFREGYKKGLKSL